MTRLLPPFAWWIVGSCALMAVAANGVWAVAYEFRIGGIGGDGAIVLVLAILAAAVGIVAGRSARRPRRAWPLVVCLVLGILGALIGAVDWVSVERVVTDGDLPPDFAKFLDANVSVGWGLVASTIGSVSLAIASTFGLFRRGRAAVGLPGGAPSVSRGAPEPAPQAATQPE